jgi:hypothetical protein
MILKFLQFINESNEQDVYLDDNKGGPGFTTKKYLISSLNQKILKHIESVYGQSGFVYGQDNKDIGVNDKILNTEYISKMVNNYTIFKTFIRENRITNERDFYQKIESSFADIYSPDGDFFKRQTLPILINTTRKGNRLEQKAKEAFVRFAKTKGLTIELVNPTISEDIKGIDSKFIHNGKTYTIQVKPLSNVTDIDNNIEVVSDGSLSLSTDYLIVVGGVKIVIARSKNVSIIGNRFVIPKVDVLWMKV